MLLPLFDKDCEHVGWIAPNQHIFDTDMNWVAYISSSHAWSAESGDWLGAVHNVLCLGQDGRPVAWNPQQPVTGTPQPARPARAARAARPARPARPAGPARPAQPATPAGGWSGMSFSAWLAQ